MKHKQQFRFSTISFRVRSSEPFSRLATDHQSVGTTFHVHSTQHVLYTGARIRTRMCERDTDVQELGKKDTREKWERIYFGRLC